MEDADCRYNTFVDFVNANKPKEELVPPIQTDEENKLFDNMVKELAEMRKEDPQASFAHYDSEWGFYDCGYDLD